MYLDFWKLDRRPFDNTPDPDFFYPSQEHEEALSRFFYVIEENKGAAMLTGEYGCGKTMTLRKIFASLDEEKYEVAYLNNPRWEPDELLQDILFQLGVEDYPSGIMELGRKIGDVLFQNVDKGKETIIVIDEAQLIHSDLVLEELRLILNYQLNDMFMVCLILAGQPELRERVMGMPQLEQRMFIKYHLHTFDYDNTKDYIAHRLKIAGSARPIFTDDAIEAIYKHSFGTPRRINNICDISLMIGSQKKIEMIDSNFIKSVI